MIMKLSTLKIENFRVIKNFEITPNGSNLAVFGKNKCGKTTLYDAFLWLLFGKNSAGETKFGIKPTMLPQETENSVEADFFVDGKPLTLKKVYASKYIKSTGEYKGSELEYYINGVPKKKNEYESAISEIINEDKFKLLTNPKYFTETLEWKSRRNILFELAGEKSDAELAAENPEFSAIFPYFEQLGSATELLKSVSAQVKKNSERINILPKLINENAAKLSNVTASEETLTGDICTIKAKIAANNEKIGALKAWTPTSNPEYEDLKQQLDEILHRNSEYRYEQEKRLKEEKDNYNSTLSRLNSELFSLNSKKSAYEDKIAFLSRERNELLKKRNEITERKWSGSEICPTCGQAIPEEIISKSKSEFERKVSEELEENTAKGKDVRAKLDSVTAENNAVLKDIMAVEAKIKDLKPPVSSNVTFDLPEFEETKAEIENKMEIIENSAEEFPHTAEIEALISKNAEFEIEITKMNGLISEIRENDKLLARIDELKVEQASLRSEQAKLQQRFDLVNAFVRFKTDSVTESINAKFRLARFKLFEPNKTNDGLQECCEALAFNAVRYNDINTAGKVLVGVDIISTLAEHYGLSVPLFIDNIDGLDSDSYKQLKDSISGTMQLITLRVSNNDDTLRTEEF